MTAPALWACGVLGKVHGLRGELYLNLSPGGLERLELGSDWLRAVCWDNGLRLLGPPDIP